MGVFRDGITSWADGIDEDSTLDAEWHANYLVDAISKTDPNSLSVQQKEEWSYVASQMNKILESKHILDSPARKEIAARVLSAMDKRDLPVYDRFE